MRQDSVICRSQRPADFARAAGSAEPAATSACSMRSIASAPLAPACDGLGNQRFAREGRDLGLSHASACCVVPAVRPQPPADAPAAGCRVSSAAPPQCATHARTQTKGKVGRPYRYVREDFFLGGGVIRCRAKKRHSVPMPSTSPLSKSIARISASVMSAECKDDRHLRLLRGRHGPVVDRHRRLRTAQEDRAEQFVERQQKAKKAGTGDAGPGVGVAGTSNLGREVGSTLISFSRPDNPA